MQFRASSNTQGRPLSGFTIWFLGVFILEILSNFFITSFPYFHYVAKPLVMISLIVFFTRETYSRQRLGVFLMQGALFFSLLGDVFLMIPDEGPTFFILGLGAFLLAHVAYIGVFSYWPEPVEGEPAILRRKWWLWIPFLTYGLGLVYLVYPELGALWWPVMIYAAVLMGMVLAALNRWKRVPDESFGYVFLGAMLFMLSDSLIALDRFGQAILSIPLAHTWIMMTYMSAQYLIVRGMLKAYRATDPRKAYYN